MPRASSYFLARREGGRGLLRRSASCFSNACWMGGGAPARSRSKRLVLRACTSVLVPARSECIADQRMRRLVGLADPPRLGERLFEGIDLFGFEFDRSCERTLGGEHGFEQVASFQSERLAHALGKCDLTLGTHFLYCRCHGVLYKLQASMKVRQVGETDRNHRRRRLAMRRGREVRPGVPESVPRARRSRESGVLTCGLD